MSLWNKGPDPIISLLEGQISSLKDENTYLRTQVSKLQEALMAKESPEAYRMMKADESWVQDGMREKSEKRRAETNIAIRLMQERETRLFEDTEELLSALGQVIGTPQPKPIGDGEEG